MNAIFWALLINVCLIRNILEHLYRGILEFSENAFQFMRNFFLIDVLKNMCFFFIFIGMMLDVLNSGMYPICIWVWWFYMYSARQKKTIFQVKIIKIKTTFTDVWKMIKNNAFSPVIQWYSDTCRQKWCLKG